MSGDVSLAPAATPDRVEEYSGTIEECEYGCGDGPEYFVDIAGGVLVACRSCLRDSGIYPVDNDWVEDST